MKRRFAISAVVLSAVFGLALYPSAGYAQTSQHSALTVKVPFEFVVGNQTFPAGTYKFHSLLNSVPGKDTIEVLEVRSTEGHQYKAIVTDVVGGDQPTNARVVFARSGARTLLDEVWEPGRRVGCRLHSRTDLTQAVENETDRVTLIASADGR